MGKQLDQRAHDWVAYMTDQQGEYHSTETNDAGALTALSALAKHQKINPERIMLLRGISNFDMPPAGISAAKYLLQEGPQSYAGYIPSLEGLYQVGSTVVGHIIKHWEQLNP